MNNDFLIPLLVTLVTAMAIGAIYLLILLMNDGKPAEDDEETLADFAADASPEPLAQSETEPDATSEAATEGNAVAPAEAQHT